MATVITCAAGHDIQPPAILPGRALPTLTCWACIAGVPPVEPPSLEPWLVAELQRGSGHLDGFTWRLDPPTDEAFNIPQMGDTAQPA